MRSCSSLLLLCACLSGLPAWAVGRDAGALAQADTALGPVELVSALFSYTQWPASAQPLLLCISDAFPEAAALQAQSARWRLKREVLTRLVTPDEPLPPGCDAVLFDRWGASFQRDALLGLAGRPVLSIGWGAGFCSDGGLACLSTGRSGLRFELNLDVVARSGLRIHPQVLRLTRPRTVEGRS